jgi:hypothetical protein
VQAVHAKFKYRDHFVHMYLNARHLAFVNLEILCGVMLGTRVRDVKAKKKDYVMLFWWALYQWWLN